MLICHIITGLTDGGAEAVLYRLCKHDTKNEHIVVSLLDSGKYGILLENIGVKVHLLNFQNKKNILSGVIELFRLLKNIKPDVVQTWMYHADFFGGIVAKLVGVKKIVWGVHHTNLVRGESKKGTIFIAKINSILSKFIPDNIIYCAEKSRQAQEEIGFNKSRGVVVYNGYEVNDFYPNENYSHLFREEFKIENDFIIGNVGRFNPQKDHINFILASNLVSKKYNNVKFILVGTDLDESNNTIVNKINDLELREKYLLLGRRDDINVVMNGMDIHVLSSSFGEAFPNVLNEAMSCGTPCVTTDIGDAGLIVGETGWIVSAKDPEALANAIIEAIIEKQTTADLWEKRRDECRNRIVNNFSIEKMSEAYNHVWSSN
jgi:glycosyltransferase involved in cell wall biosynthesis